jgi:hypothetical protein
VPDFVRLADRVKLKKVNQAEKFNIDHAAIHISISMLSSLSKAESSSKRLIGGFCLEDNQSFLAGTSLSHIRNDSILKEHVSDIPHRTPQNRSDNGRARTMRSEK